ncbi:type II 3-dehydroquinate dehydratase [Flammeovirga kamogawensis]|uniref:3-dehydroquinate dehydratase n=1 Tax=Flammeovirga kamogawensis TaxID=373891 RepID=A0ABX8GVR6_9BACT|nr:type II 3-dehydroquinate dehydratase [Flammeovirga kamogawensis]MBB6461656.1 3-dehydroquinate dehydratase-2 [Flammeovirga kamogawensis]QWG07418.1 type II 3-dehydroquinate dehydratase [Flammeovirga kamogawensis]TRX69229.1 type II 3-dehydroquinate dehydratase [Flammeovirga kamogawensis]
MKLLILNGPNLNLLGKREPTIYGNTSFEEYFDQLTSKYPDVDMVYKQSNHEGTLVDIIHEYGFDYDGIVLNAGAYTHTSVAIADAIAGVETPVIEVHISNVHAREAFRHTSYMAKNCVGTIAGLGLKGYELAAQFFLEQ